MLAILLVVGAICYLTGAEHLAGRVLRLALLLIAAATSLPCLLVLGKKYSGGAFDLGQPYLSFALVCPVILAVLVAAIRFRKHRDHLHHALKKENTSLKRRLSGEP